MKSVSVTRKLSFCAGHRVFLHESKCANPHGHNYTLFATFYPVASLDALGRVVDFSVIKQRLGSWIDLNWDHGFIYFEEDKEIKNLFLDFGSNWKTFQLTENPTAENLAAHILHKVCPMLFQEVICSKVVLWETENCYAEVSL